MLTAEQLAVRKTGIAASDVAAILGLSRFRTRLDVFNDKVNPAPATDALANNPYIEWGNRLEPVIRDKFVAAHPEIGPWQPPATFRNKAKPWMIATPDGVAGAKAPEGAGPVVLEIKTCSSHRKKDWELGEVPDEYRMQIHWQMMVTGAPVGMFAVLIGGNEYLEAEVERDQDVEALIAEEAERFWVDHVLAKVPPQPETPEERVAACKALAHKSESLLEPTPEDIALAMEFLKVRAAREEASARMDDLASKLKLRIGENAGLAGVATWKADKAKKEVCWEAVAQIAGVAPPPTLEQACRMALERKHALGILKADPEGVLASCIKEKPGSRRFLVKASLLEGGVK